MGNRRCLEPGYDLLVQDDSSFRRGVWGRLDAEERELDLCSGREGDDCSLQLRVGHVLTTADLHDLYWLIAHGSAPDIDYAVNANCADCPDLRACRVRGCAKEMSDVPA